MPIHALDALGNPVRRQILAALRRGPLPVGEIARRFPVSRPAISRHLRILREGGLVETQADGYAIRLRGFQPVRKFLDDFWDIALHRLAEAARK